jgi:tetratricopeptide (TPR) repeat protein
MLHLDQGLVCRLCAEARAKEAKTSGRSIQLSRIIDPTICWKCKTDYGEKDLPSIAGVPVCGTCALALYESPFPGWLKASLAALLGLLAVALWTGRPYFTAGRHLMLAERALDQSDFATASVHFGEVLKVGPTDQKVVLLGAKASILSGDPEQGQRFLNQRDSFSMDGLFAEVSGLVDHLTDAFNKAGQAAQQDSLGHEEEAARLMNEASRAYPQSRQLAVSALLFDGRVAYDRKDYDALLQVSRDALARLPDNPTLVAGVASALACKYAVTGNPEFRHEAERLLVQARTLSLSSPEEAARFDEYAERIPYRLDSRVIIDKDEYDRRFRHHQARR